MKYAQLDDGDDSEHNGVGIVEVCETFATQDTLFFRKTSFDGRQRLCIFMFMIEVCGGMPTVREVNLQHVGLLLLKYPLKHAPAGKAGAHFSGYLNN